MTQLAAQLRAAILDGRLPSGTALPSSRALARALEVARGVVVDAYAELTAEGSLESRIGSGTRVAAGIRTAPETVPAAPAWLPVRPPAPVGQPPQPGLLDFRLGQPTTLTLDRRAWTQAFAHVAHQLPPSDYGDAAGEPDLRAALAAFTGRLRGLRVDPAQVIVTAGTVQALDLIARALLGPGDTVLVEDPGYRLAQARLTDTGARLHPLPIDEDGPVLDDLPPAKLALVTPSHQYPTGVRMSLSRRLALLAWAERHDALIIEDDYDGEYRYGAAPLPPLASLDGSGRVIYLGTLSKVLSPSLRLGWLVASPTVRALLLREKHLADAGNPWPVQVAVTQFLRQGQLDRHVRRTRRHYAAAQATLARALAPVTPVAHLGGIEAGLHACLHLAPQLDARAVAAECLRRGVRVGTLQDFALSLRPGNALVLGYGGLTLHDIERGAAVIVGVLREMG